MSPAEETGRPPRHRHLAAKAQTLIFSPACVNNLALYLTKAKKEVRGEGACGDCCQGLRHAGSRRSHGGSQLKREEVVIIGVACAGVHGGGIAPNEPLSERTIARKCRECTVHEPKGADVVCGTVPTLPVLTPIEQEELAKLEAMAPAERWAYWKEQFSRCIRCMACRQVCPFCYCEQCLCDRNRPQAIDSSPRPAGNWRGTSSAPCTSPGAAPVAPNANAPARWTSR